MEEEKGITLIALVITIIVMLILTGATIAIVIQGGLITKAQDAKILAKQSMAKEKLELAIGDLQINKLGQATLMDLNEFNDENSLNYKENIKIDPIINTEDITANAIIDDTYSFLIDEKFNCTIKNIEQDSNQDETEISDLEKCEKINNIIKRISLIENIGKINLDYSNSYTIPYPTQTSQYTATEDGIYLIGFHGTNNTITLYINGIASPFIHTSASSYRDLDTMFIPLSVGDIIYWNNATYAALRANEFVPYKDNSTTYEYVKMEGETNFTEEEAKNAYKLLNELANETDIIENNTNEISAKLGKAILDYDSTYDVTYPTINNKYTVLEDGVYLACFHGYNDTIRMYINNEPSSYIHSSGTSNREVDTMFIPVYKGDIIYWDTAYVSISISKIVPYGIIANNLSNILNEYNNIYTNNEFENIQDFSDLIVDLDTRTLNITSAINNLEEKSGKIYLDYSNAVNITFPILTNKYTTLEDGVYITCFNKGANGATNLYINGITNNFVRRDSSGYIDMDTMFIPLQSNDQIYWDGNYGTLKTNKFVPYK